MLPRADTSSLSLYKGKKLSKTQMIARLRLHVTKIFGYGWLPKSIVDDSGLDTAKLAREMGCMVIEGSLGYGFVTAKVVAALEFGDKPDKKTLKRMVKEEKTKNEKHRSKSS